MFRFVTKEEYWDAENRGLLEMMPRKLTWHMKSIQDTIALDHLYGASGAAIAEVGGGDSRVLPVLAQSNACTNIEEFKGANQGPSQIVTLSGVKNVRVRLGEFSDQLAEKSFDLVFSISVIEHIPDDDQLERFFADCLRILKPGGVMLHLIDIYLEDEHERNVAARHRMRQYNKVFRAGFVPVDPGDVLDPETAGFSCRFATNPDNIMNEWNRMVPQLAPKRARAQHCSLLLKATRRSAPTSPGS